MALLKLATQWNFTCYKLAKRLVNNCFLRKTSPRLHQFQSQYFSVSKCSLEEREGQSLVCDVDRALLRTPSLFPFFMLVAFEGGSLLRAFLLLLCFPLVWVLGEHSEMSVRIMVFVTFCGLRTRSLDLVTRAVFPKFCLENLHLQAYELLQAATGKRVAFTSMPRLMVEGFLGEYLAVGKVVGAELQVAKGCYFSGLTYGGPVVSAKQKALKDLFGEAKADVAIVSPSSLHHFMPYSKEIYLVTKEEAASRVAKMPISKYPKPLIFHDGRLAFLPTPSATLALFMWLPVAIPLSVFRIGMGIVCPYKVALSIGSFTGIRFRVGGLHTFPAPRSKKGGVLYVCTHRTLLDPVMLCAALQRAVPAVTYSLSRMSEMLAPLTTVRLTRDRDRDAATMQRLLREGDLAVCPEGTTCREPYLLRFSSLFAELAEEIVPVAMDARVTMFYGTTASGHKWLDPVVFMMDPLPAYKVDVLGPVPPELTCKGEWSATDAANRIQRQLADALGFECTALTRRDKYMMLAGNEGVAMNRGDGKKH